MTRPKEHWYKWEAKGPGSTALGLEQTLEALGLWQKVMAATRDWSGTEVTTREGRRKVSVHHGVQERIDSCHRGTELGRWLPLGKGKDDSCLWERSIYHAFWGSGLGCRDLRNSLPVQDGRHYQLRNLWWLGLLNCGWANGGGLLGHDRNDRDSLLAHDSDMVRETDVWGRANGLLLLRNWQLSPECDALGKLAKRVDTRKVSWQEGRRKTKDKAGQEWTRLDWTR